MHKLALRTLLALCLIRAVSGCVLEAAPFDPNDRWAVLRDSITHNGYYHRYIELFYFTRFPSQQHDVINCGISGDTAPGALRRLQWDCLASKPAVVSVMFGMNDIGRYLYEAGNAITSARSETGMIKYVSVG